MNWILWECQLGREMRRIADATFSSFRVMFRNHTEFSSGGRIALLTAPLRSRFFHLKISDRTTWWVRLFTITLIVSFFGGRWVIKGKLSRSLHKRLCSQRCKACITLSLNKWKVSHTCLWFTSTPPSLLQLRVRLFTIKLICLSSGGIATKSCLMSTKAYHVQEHDLVWPPC